MQVRIGRRLFVAINVLLLQLATVGYSQLLPLDGQSPSGQIALDEGQLSDGLLFGDPRDESGSNAGEQRDEFAYLEELQKRQPRLDLDVLQELVEGLRQSENPVAPQLNKHLPSDDPFGRETSTSGPINNPDEFDASLSQLTNSLNHWIPNTGNRMTLIDGLLSDLLNHRSGPPSSQINDSAADPVLISGLRSGSEYIDNPLAIVGHQYVQGGAGEGHQLLGPDGSFENVQVIKTDLAMPSYCDPPNPCPIGYTAEDGCLEDFVNSASFSRDYQVKQKCSCDNEHSLFNCGEPPSSTINNNIYPLDGDHADAMQMDGASETSSYSDSRKLETLARAIQNRFGNIASVRNLIDSFSN